METLAVSVTRETREILERFARARCLRPEDVAGEAVDLHARRLNDFRLRFNAALARVREKIRAA